MTSVSTRTVSAKDRTFPAKAPAMLPDDAIPIMNERLSHWLKGHYRRDAAKRLQCDFGIGQRAAEYALAGEISAPLFRRILAGFGAPLADFLFKPAHRTGADFLDIAHDTHLAASASVVSLGSAFGMDVSAGGIRRGGDIHPPAGYLSGRDARLGAMCGDGVRDDGARATPSGTRIGRAARELMAFSGRLELHEPIGLDAADSRHAQLLAVWRNCGGELTSGFIALMDELGLAELASVYTPEIKVQRIGTGTLFWTEDQRRAVIGKSIFEIPASPPFVRAVFDRLTETVERRQPTNTLLTFDTGICRATWKRMAFPFTGCIIGSPALQAAV